MKKSISILLVLAMQLASVSALATGPAEPWKGDQGGVVAAKIDAAIRSGKDPSQYLVAPISKGVTAPKQPSGETVTDVMFVEGSTVTTTISGLNAGTYSRFRTYALKLFESNYSLKYTFGSFEAYFASVINAETRNYYASGSSKNVTLSEYFQLIIDYRRMPAYS